MASYLHLIQVNLGKSFKATQTLTNNLLELKQDITLVQEPYALKNKVIGFSLKDKIIAYDENPKTAIIIHNKDIEIFPVMVAQKLIIVKIKWDTKQVTIINCYIPPKETIETIIRQIEVYIVSNVTEHIILAGDFNSKNKIWGGDITDDRGSGVLEFVTRNNLNILNNNSIPTFETSNGRSWIDLTIVSRSVFLNIDQWEVLETPSNSDHRYIQIKAFSKPANREKRLTKMGEYKLMQEIKEDNWFETIIQEEIKETEQLDYIINKFYSRIDKLKEKHSKVVKPSNSDKISKPWWTAELEIERKKVRAHRRRFQKARDQQREVYKKQYYEAFAVYQKNINESKDKSWKQYCAEIRNKNPFNLAYKIAGKKLKKPVSLVPVKKANGELTASLEETVEEIIKSLYHIHERQNLTQDENDNGVIDEITNELSATKDVTGSKDDIPFSENEIDNIIKHLKKRTAPGPDKITTTFLQAIYDMHKNFFHHILNSALKLKYFPMAWRKARVILIPKQSNNKEDAASSFRPIAINSIFGKIYEKLLYHRIYHYLHINKLIPKNQYGFTHGTSAVNALDKIKRTLQKAKLDKLKAIIISLDIKNAFGSIKTTTIIKELKNLKIPHNLVEIITHLLHRRSITYELPSKSMSFALANGTPQGSPLSPIFWNLVITKILNTSMPPGVQIQAYADDITVTVIGKSRIEIETRGNQALASIHSWSINNDLKFSPGKCEYLIIGKEYQNRPPTLKLGPNPIRKTMDIKILGVTFDHNLTFQTHLQNIKEKVQLITLELSKFSANNWGMSAKQLRDIYIRGIERTIVYGSPIWYINNSHLQRKLRSIQRLPLIKICKGYRTIPNIALNVITKIPPLHLTIEKENEIFRIKNHQKIFTWNDQQFDANTMAPISDIWAIHPGQRKSFKYSTKEANADYNIYTDGSEWEGRCGASYVIIDNNGQIVDSKIYKLPTYSSNFEAEVTGITKAIEKISTMDNTKFYQILTDSLSVLKGLQNPHNKNFFISKIKEKLSILREFKISFTYVPAHKGIFGNETADELAKKAASTGEYVELPITLKFIKKKLKEKYLDIWNSDWNKMGKNTYTYEWVKSVKKIPIHFPLGHWGTQAVSAHGRFPYYLNRFLITNDLQCKCGETASSFDHYLTCCPIVKAERGKLQKKYKQNISKHKQEIANDKQDMEIIEEIVRKINQIILL